MNNKIILLCFQLKKVCPDGVFSSVTLGGPHSASEEEVILSTRAEAGCWVVPHILNKVGSGNQALVSITSDIGECCIESP